MTNILPPQVHLGDSAPVTREGAGSVPSDSLAAESARSGGDFGLNRDSAPGSGPSSHQHDKGGKVSAPGEGGSNAGTSGALENQRSYAGTAPTYVNRQYQTYEGGPKGKDLKEVRDFEGENKDGVRAALESEPGSEMDPGREAEARFGLERDGEGRVEEQGGGGESGQRRFGVLDETSA